MTRASKRNAAYAVVLIVMLVLAWLTHREAEGIRAPLAAFDFDTVESVRIEVRGEAPRVFERSADGWRMTEPLELAVDERRLAGVVTGFNTASIADYPVADTDVDALGIGASPNARVIVDGEEFVLGGTDAVNHLRYVRRGDTLHLVADLVYFRLHGDPAAWAAEQ